MSSERPADTALLSLPGPHDVLRRTLANGVTVLARENWSAPSVVIEGYLEAGGLDEPPGLPGVASYTASMLSRGTRRRSFAEISEQIETVGASLGFSGDRYVTSFSAKSLVEDLDLLLGTVAEELREPTFPAEHVEKVRGQRMVALAERENSTRQMASLAFREMLFPGHPLGRSLLGDRASIGAIRRDDLVEFYEKYYRPRGMVVAVVGAVAAEEAAARVERFFGDWSGERPAPVELASVERPREVRSRVITMPDKSQSDVVLGWHSLRRLDPGYEAARLANTILGVFGMYGRLGLSVREREGMAYYAFSQLSADKVPGIWAITAGVNPANVSRATQVILDEVQRLRDEPVPEEELHDSQRFLTGSLPLQLETNDGVASTLVDIEWYRLGLDYLERYRGLVNGVTTSEVQEAARRYLDPDAYVIAVAGP